MPFSVATWNINSVRLRIDLVRHFLGEIPAARSLPAGDQMRRRKLPARALPPGRLPPHRNARAEGLSRRRHRLAPAASRSVDSRQFCGKDDARHIAATVDHRGRPITIHNFYVPAGGDEPDPKINPKFAHKLSFVDEMRRSVPDARPARLHPRRRSQHRPAGDRRLVAQAASEGGQPHAGGDGRPGAGAAPPAAGST